MVPNDIYTMICDWITIVMWSIHIRQFWYQIQNLHKKCFQMIYISFYLAELPFWPHPYCNTNIRFSISSKNAFKWYIYILSYLAELPFLASPIPYYVILISDSASPQKMLSNDISPYLAELPFLAPSIPYQAMLISESKSPQKLLSSGMQTIQ